MDKNMFCFQCEQTIGCSGCTGNSGVCGKTADTAKLQDELTGALSVWQELLTAQQLFLKKLVKS